MSLCIPITGATVAGKVASCWPGRARFDLTVVPPAPAFRDGRRNIDVRGVGGEVLRRMGWSRPRSTGEPARKALPGSRSRIAACFPPGDLARLLDGAARGRASDRFGDRIERIDSDEAGATVLFAGGARERYDVVIVAEVGR